MNSAKPSVLAFVKKARERDAAIEILDCILPYDPNAKFRILNIPGIIVIESKLNGLEIIRILENCFVSQAKRIIPIGDVVKSNPTEIINDIIKLAEGIKNGGARFKIELKNYDSSNTYKPIIDVIARKLIMEKGWIVKLKEPDITIFIHIFSDEAYISIVKRGEMWELKKYL
ncbi:MAG: THUMP domain-containing protein [archaeon YNP-LCB-024-027]|nr:THUMP domain-containing protein [Candidatus Culexarchaeum yellowstonense]